MTSDRMRGEPLDLEREEFVQYAELAETWRRTGFNSWGERAIWQLTTKLQRVEAERDELRRQVEAARTALEETVDHVDKAHGSQRESWAGEVCEVLVRAREALAALAPQTGEVGS